MTDGPRFTVVSRILHWGMAVLILAMLFIGIGMVATVSERYELLVVVVRIANRLFNPPPPLPRHLPAWQKLAAKASHFVLYALMLTMPLVGWGMLSAAGYPIVLYGPLHLPPILPHDAALYAALRSAHTLLAYLLFATILAHLGAALMHALIHRDGVFASMASWKRP
ncbi:cytochrome b [Inquilinus limosus]|uniref:cytochrome b n=1 Tax=Inquilinus limosus TaxID=171674 RepID=UPI000423DF99|nr:cytochrome b/b6 domain-containing protein [Inquilinus limosus]